MFVNVGYVCIARVFSRGLIAEMVADFGLMLRRLIENPNVLNFHVRVITAS
jgi:hypothetical protein